MTIQIVGDSFIAIKPYSLTYDEKKMPYDTLRFRGKYTFLLLDNYGNAEDVTLLFLTMFMKV
jgi:hypothetical protein